MKKIIFAILGIVALLGCQTKYELNTNFTAPTQLDAPELVILDVTSAERVILSWSGGEAEDGGLILYNVLFDAAGGNFSNPLASFQSDKGSQARLTLTHAQLNQIAQAGGVEPNETGDFIWTVIASKGGTDKACGISQTMTLTRGEGIDDNPESLAIAGDAALEAGQVFRKVKDGEFSIVTRLQAGSLYFTEGESRYYLGTSGKLVKGSDSYALATAPSTGLARVTVSFNTLSMKIEEINPTVGAQFAANNVNFLELNYEGNGVFSGSAEVTLLGPGRPNTPSWCSWTEERYSFIANVDGTSVRWGSKFAGSNDAILPDGSEDFYDIHEVQKTDWGNLWKMSHSFDLKAVKITIYTNKDDKFTHTLEETVITPDPGDPTYPEAVSLYGAGAEVEGQSFIKVSTGVYRIYAKLKGGEITVKDDTKTYKTYTCTATPSDADATRLTVDLKNDTVTEEVVNKLRCLYGATFEDVVTLAYQGQGVWQGTGTIYFRSVSWGMDERYYFIPTIDGEQSKCWGRLDSVDAENRPDGNQSADYFNCAEFGWEQWYHLWKFASNTDGSNCQITFETNKNGVMTHSVIVQ